MTAKTSNLPVAHVRASQASVCRALALALALTHSARAHAQSNAADSDRANVLFKRGKVAFNDGKFSDALRIYTEAWQLKHSPDVAANLAQTESELGKHRDAAEHFAFALAHLLPSSTDEQKKALADGLDIEKKEVGTLHVTLEPADAALSVDDAPVTLPASGDLYVEPGEHHCSVTREGYDANRQTVQVSKGGSQVLWIKLNPAGGAVGAVAMGASPTDSTARKAESPPSSVDGGGSGDRSLVPVFVGGGIAAVGLALGVGFLVSGNSHRDKAGDLTAQIPGQNGCSAGTPYGPDCASLHNENQSAASARRLETVSFAVAGAATVGTIAYLLWPLGEHRPSSRATGAVFSALIPSFGVGRSMGTLGVSGSF